MKIQLTITINFIPSKDVDEERVVHSNGDNIELMPYDNANELSKSLLTRHQVVLKKLMKCSGFFFQLVQLLYYKRHNINFPRGGHIFILQTG